VKLSEVCDIQSGNAFKSKEYVDEGIRVIRITNVQKGEIVDDDPKFLPLESKEKHAKYLLEEGDILISQTGNVGRVGRITSNLLPAYLNQRVAKISNNSPDDVYDDYLFWILNNESFERDAVYDSSGVAQKNLSMKWINNYKIPLPSLSEQKAIVAKLDRAQRLIDIDRKMLAKYDELIQSVFLEMFGEVFSNKTETPFEDHLGIKHGYAFKSKWFDDEGDVPVVKIGTVNKSTVDFSEVQFLDESYAEEYERFKVYPGDLLLSMTGTVGKDDYANPCVMTNDYGFYLLNQRVVKLNYDENIFTKSFLYHFFKQDYIKRELTKFSRGIRQANLSNKDIYGLSFQKPDFDKQLQFEALCDKVEKEKRSLKESTQKSGELFSSLVQGAFG